MSEESRRAKHGLADQLRPVWLTGEQRDALARIYRMHRPAVVGPIIDAWDAAPTDAVHEARNAVKHVSEADAVLRALGMPQSSGGTQCE
jgi:hypothetical protein